MHFALRCATKSARARYSYGCVSGRYGCRHPGRIRLESAARRRRSMSALSKRAVGPSRVSRIQRISHWLDGLRVRPGLARGGDGSCCDRTGTLLLFRTTGMVPAARRVGAAGRRAVDFGLRSTKGRGNVRGVFWFFSLVLKKMNFR
jgi:hypothetical protein